MVIIKKLTKLIPSIGYIMLSIIDLYKLTAIVSSSCDKIQLLISSILGLAVLILFIIKPDIECILHECGHSITILLVGVISKCDLQVVVHKEGKLYRTSSSIDDWLIKNRKYWLIRLYSLGGVGFIVVLCVILYFMAFTINCIIGIKCFLLFVANAFIYQELVGLTNGRLTNDLNIFLHPQVFHNRIRKPKLLSKRRMCRYKRICKCKCKGH